MRKFHLKKKCTCHGTEGRHYLSCDLMYIHGKSAPKKRKRFFIFYPMKRVK